MWDYNIVVFKKVFDKSKFFNESMALTLREAQQQKERVKDHALFKYTLTLSKMFLGC